MKRFAFQIACLLVFLITGCGEAPSSTVQHNRGLLKPLKITEWDLSNHIGKTVTVQDAESGEDKIEFPVRAGTRLVTQVSGANRVVIVYVIDSTGVASTVIQTGDDTDALRTGDLSTGTLYSLNDSQVITFAAMGQ